MQLQETMNNQGPGKKILTFYLIWFFGRKVLSVTIFVLSYASHHGGITIDPGSQTRDHFSLTPALILFP